MMAAYSASKFGLEAFIDSLRVELKPWNIKVSGIEPGKIKTEIYKKTFSIIKEQNDNRNKNEVELYKDLLDIAYYNVEHA
jgi:NAD(P)-dependent dehydrogenase (short-subunit alcohol dehydrogenase family)